MYGIMTSAFGNMKTLHFYAAVHTLEIPSIDGRLDDPCWEKAVIHDNYYSFSSLEPELGKLKTTLRMLWDKHGLYLGIVNHEVNISGMQARHSTRDASDIWKDDCAELYFDPQANGVGFTKFIVNSLGAFSDMRRIDTAVILADWNAYGVQIATLKNKDSWNIEMFIPWGDLGQEAKTGELWKFCHMRFDWSYGKFIGMTMAPGASYTTPGNFGYLYFSKEEVPDRNTIARVMTLKATPPWCLPVDDGLLLCEKGPAVFEKISVLIGRERDKLASEIKKLAEMMKSVTDSDLNKRFSEQAHAITATQSAPDTFQLLRTLFALQDKVKGLTSTVELHLLTNSLN
jgi:hypothetical protein